MLNFERGETRYIWLASRNKRRISFRDYMPGAWFSSRRISSRLINTRARRFAKFRSRIRAAESIPERRRRAAALSAAEIKFSSSSNRRKAVYCAPLRLIIRVLASRKPASYTEIHLSGSVSRPRTTRASHLARNGVTDRSFRWVRFDGIFEKYENYIEKKMDYKKKKTKTL